MRYIPAESSLLYIRRYYSARYMLVLGIYPELKILQTDVKYKGRRRQKDVDSRQLTTRKKEKQDRDGASRAVWLRSIVYIHPYDLLLHNDDVTVSWEVLFNVLLSSIVIKEIWQWSLVRRKCYIISSWSLVVAVSIILATENDGIHVDSSLYITIERYASVLE